MDNEKELDFDFGGDESNNPETGGKNEFEDIVSDTSLADENGMLISDIKAGKHGRAQKQNWWRRLKKWKKVTIIAVLSFMLAAGGFLAWLRFVYFGYNYDDISNDHSFFDSAGQIDEKIINIALFGIDTRDVGIFTADDAKKAGKEIPRSDSIMILSINTETKQVKIFSVMRDSFVPVTKEESTRQAYRKINAAYTKGPEIAIRTLNSIFDLDITEYAAVNFYGMAEIIDAVGGIDITVIKEELVKNPRKNSPGLNQCMDEICANLGIDPKNYYITEPGTYHVNGIQAVAYSRIRHYKSVFGTNDDYGRTDRQRYVMEQLFNKALALKKMEYPSFVHKLIPYVKTSLEANKILSIAGAVMFDNPTFYQARIPQADWEMSNAPMYGTYGSTVYYDLDYAKEVIHACIYDGKTLEEYVEENGIRKTNWYAGSAKSGETVTDNGENPVDKNTDITEPAEPAEPDVTEPDEPVEPAEPDVTDPAEPTEPGDGESSGGAS